MNNLFVYYSTIEQFQTIKLKTKINYLFIFEYKLLDEIDGKHKLNERKHLLCLLSSLFTENILNTIEILIIKIYK